VKRPPARGQTVEAQLPPAATVSEDVTRKLSIPLLIGLLCLALAGVAIAREAVGTPGNDVLRGGDGPDQLYGEAGADTLLALGGDDYVEGGPGADAIVGGPGVDLLIAGTRNDSVRGDAGRDSVYAGQGNDRVSGGPDGDTLLGQVGHDRLRGGGGPDRMWGGSGADRVDGESGNDYLTASAESLMDGGYDDDRIYLHNEGGVARPLADASGFATHGGPGNDSIDARDGRSSSVDCGPGSDRAYLDPGDRTRGCERRIERPRQ
jgi:Ca2+-binding RTX toxin-like protein